MTLGNKARKQRPDKHTCESRGQKVEQTPDLITAIQIVSRYQIEHAKTRYLHAKTKDVKKDQKTRYKEETRNHRPDRCQRANIKNAVQRMHSKLLSKRQQNRNN